MRSASAIINNLNVVSETALTGNLDTKWQCSCKIALIVRRPFGKSYKGKLFLSKDVNCRVLNPTFRHLPDVAFQAD